MPQRCLEQGFVRAVICRNCAADNQQQHLPPNTCDTDNQQHHLPRNTCALGWLGRCKPYGSIGKQVPAGKRRLVTVMYLLVLFV